jgi:hypothetical protein
MTKGEMIQAIVNPLNVALFAAGAIGYFAWQVWQAM